MEERGPKHSVGSLLRSKELFQITSTMPQGAHVLCAVCVPCMRMQLVSAWRASCSWDWCQRGWLTTPLPLEILLPPHPRRINTALTFAIRLAKNPVKTNGPAKDYKRIDNEKRPDAVSVVRSHGATGFIRNVLTTGGQTAQRHSLSSVARWF